MSSAVQESKPDAYQLPPHGRQDLVFSTETAAASFLFQPCPPQLGPLPTIKSRFSALILAAPVGKGTDAVLLPPFNRRCYEKTERRRWMRTAWRYIGDDKACMAATTLAIISQFDAQLWVKRLHQPPTRCLILVLLSAGLSLSWALFQALWPRWPAPLISAS